MSRIKVYDGHKWIDKPEAFKVKTAKGFTKATVRRFDGHKWEVISSTRKVKTWEATWTQSYWGWNEAKPANRGGNRLYQGRYGAPDTQWRGDVGIQKGMAGFNDGDMRNSLKGSKIEKVEVYLHSNWWWYWAGGESVIGLHNSSGWQSKFHSVKNDVKRQRYGKREEGHWVTVPNWVGEWLRDGKARGITTFINSSNVWFYGYFYGTQGGSKRPKIRITYVN